MQSVEFMNEALLAEVRSRFHYVTEDYEGNERIFFDNAGGSLRLKAAEDAFHRVDSIPDCSEHSNKVALFLDKIERDAKEEILSVLFGAEHGVLYPSFTASQIIFELVRVISEHAVGKNYVTTVLEHPSSFDAIHYYGELRGMKVRVAGADKTNGGVNAEDILKLIDKDTAILSCMAASNISGYVYDIETICRKAREINPDIFIIVDAVQHAPHAWLDPEACGIDAMHFAPYKFFGIRGFSLAYISDRAASFMHHRLLGKSPDEWSIGSPSPAHYAAVREIIAYVKWLGRTVTGEEKDAREQFKAGMDLIAAHERALLDFVLNGDDETVGLRHMSGVRVAMDGAPVTVRDFIIGVEFENMSCEQATAEYEKRGIIAYERSASSIYSKRMLEAFDSEGVVRLSPLHVNTKEEMKQFLKVTAEIAAL